MARAAGTLSRIPEIAPFAIATEAAANGVSAVASLFGLAVRQFWRRYGKAIIVMGNWLLPTLLTILIA